MGGGLMQLVAYGAQDIYLTGNPQITFFKTIYKRHTNFSMEHIQQTFQGNPGPGARVVATVSRNGDLIHDCYIKFDMYIKNTQVYNPGHNILNNIELEIGGQLIDRQYGHFMEAHAELTEENLGGFVDSSGVKIGRYENSSVNDHVSTFQLTSGAGGINVGDNRDHHSERSSNFYVPLRFGFVGI